MARVTRVGVVLSILVLVACSSEGPPAGNGGGNGSGETGGGGGSAGHGAGGLGGAEAAGGSGPSSGGGGIGGTTSAGGGDFTSGAVGVGGADPTSGAGGVSGTGGADPTSGAGGVSGTGGADPTSGAGGVPGTGGADPTSGAGGGMGTGGAGVACTGMETVFGSEVISQLFGPGQNYGQNRFPAIAFGPPRGGGCCAGSTDVVSLGNGGTVTLGFSGNLIVDGAGPDFIVFENAMASGPAGVFAELATIEVSENGIDWYAFPCTAVAAPYGSCAGWHPVLANAVTNTIDPTDPDVAGGDGFDLAEVGLTVARYVRITDRPDITGAAGVFDLDAVAIVNASCP